MPACIVKIVSTASNPHPHSTWCHAVQIGPPMFNAIPKGAPIAFTILACKGALTGRHVVMNVHIPNDIGHVFFSDMLWLYVLWEQRYSFIPKES
jgi:hypothetical protein